MATDKPYKISYKFYHNTRLKQVFFHGREMHPLYIQVSFNRQTIYFKSYFFDLLSAPRYAVWHHSGNRYPGIRDIEAKEEKLIHFILEKYTDGFSLELFKEKYTYYSTDVLNLLDEEFKDYLFTFFSDEGDDLLARMIKETCYLETGTAISEGLRHPLKSTLYQKMMGNAAYYAPGYLPVTALQQSKGDRLLTFSIFEWETPENKAALDKLLADSFPAYAPANVIRHIKKLVRKAALSNKV